MRQNSQVYFGGSNTCLITFLIWRFTSLTGIDRSLWYSVVQMGRSPTQFHSFSFPVPPLQREAAQGSTPPVREKAGKSHQFHSRKEIKRSLRNIVAVHSLELYCLLPPKTFRCSVDTDDLSTQLYRDRCLFSTALAIPTPVLRSHFTVLAVI